MTGLAIVMDPQASDYWDIEYINGRTRITEQDEAIQHKIGQELKFFFAEWFLNQNRGIPYFQRIYVKNPDPEFLDATFKNVILSVDGVVRITRWNLQIDSATRLLQLDFTVETNFGILDISETPGAL